MTHRQKISTMCFFLNGRKQTSACYNHFDTTYNPVPIKIRNDKGDLVVEFQYLDFYYDSVCVKFNGYLLTLTFEGDDFQFGNKEDEKYAKKVFGQNATPTGIIEYAECALKEALREYGEQISKILAGNYNFV